MALPPQRDAYGQILLAHYEGRVASEIMERDDGLIYCGDPADYFHPFRRWPAYRKRAQRIRARRRAYSSPSFRYVMASPAEMERLLRGGGWHVLRVIDDGSPRYLLVLEKDARIS